MVVTKIPANKAILFIVLLCSYSSFSYALVLPEERADALYHSYDGGGVKVSGPSVLVRKNIGDAVSINANYYVDSVSSASIDVVTQASAYTEEREQQSVGVDYLYDKSIISYSYIQSVESDFEAITQSINISQEMFGGLTTVGLGYTLGDNTISRNGDDVFEEKAEIRSYRVSLSQILTKNSLMSMAYEIITDEGYLNNPYRSVRYINPDTDPVAAALNPFLWTSEVYPNTRTSNALGVAFKYYLPYRAAMSFGYKTFTDTWEISSNTFDLGYVHPLNDDWIIEFDLRFYDQSKAVFYNDLNDSEAQFTFLARDKELSTYSYQSIGVGVSYEFGRESMAWIEKGSINLNLDHFTFDYEDFLDVRNTTLATLGQEPAYSYSANVIRFYLSVWF